jgi:hypothetical protein
MIVFFLNFNMVSRTSLKHGMYFKGSNGEAVKLNDRVHQSMSNPSAPSDITSMLAI